MTNTEAIRAGQTSLGIEFGSTRIKAVLVNEAYEVIAQGSHEWENSLVDGIWTYSLEEVWSGLQDCYRDLADNVKKQYGETLTTVGAIGFSAMMHGYLAFNDKDELLVPFRTWRNTITGEACEILSEKLHFNIPQRWSIAHLYQAILNGEEHVPEITFFTTLAGYVHWQLTGEKVIGIGDAAGMFPIDSDALDYDQARVAQFDELIADRGFGWKLSEILPKVLCAGENAGYLTEAGAKLLDPAGNLQPGIPMCPPEGDAGTGMVATNSIRVRTGNVSAGTSVFAMVVLEKPLEGVYPELDLVTTPTGEAVAMVHCNNCTSDLNAWVGIFREFAESFGMKVDMNELFGTLYNKALEGDKDCGGLLAYNYFSGEPVTGFNEGRPMFVRRPDDHFNLANFMRAHLYSSLATLKVGLDIMIRREHVAIDSMMGHGGLFKTKGVGQKILAAAIDSPVAVMKTAGEGGAWGMAILADYILKKEDGVPMADFLDTHVFAGEEVMTELPDPEDVKGFDEFMVRYSEGLPIEKAAVENLR